MKYLPGIILYIQMLPIAVVVKCINGLFLDKLSDKKTRS